MAVKIPLPNAAELAELKVFGGLSDQARNEILADAQLKEVKSGGFLVRKGQEGSEVFFLLHGRAKVCVADARGKEVIVGLLGRGAVVGEIAILADVPRTADVVALSRCRALRLSRAAFLKHVGCHPELGLALLRSAARMLGRATERISDLTLNDVNVRIVHVLVEMARLLEIEGEEHLVVRERPTHQTIGSMIGASRETVTRALSELEAQGHIKVEDERVVIYSVPS